MSASVPTHDWGTEAPQVTSAMSHIPVFRCGLPQVRPPWNIARKQLTSCVLDWHLLPCIICSHNILGCLPGHLNENTQETLPLSTAWGYTPFGNRNIQETLPLSTTWGYMPSVNPNAPETLPPSTTWAYTPFVNRHIPSETPDWSEGKVLCKPCVLKLMGRHLLNFLREIKAQSVSSRPSPLLCLAIIGPFVQVDRSL